MMFRWTTHYVPLHLLLLCLSHVLIASVAPPVTSDLSRLSSVEPQDIMIKSYRNVTNYTIPQPSIDDLFSKVTPQMDRTTTIGSAGKGEQWPTSVMEGGGSLLERGPIKGREGVQISSTKLGGKPMTLQPIIVDNVHESAVEFPGKDITSVSELDSKMTTSRIHNVMVEEDSKSSKIHARKGAENQKINARKGAEISTTVARKGAVLSEFEKDNLYPIPASSSTPLQPLVQATVNTHVPDLNATPVSTSAQSDSTTFTQTTRPVVNSSINTAGSLLESSNKLNRSNVNITSKNVMDANQDPSDTIIASYPPLKKKPQPKPLKISDTNSFPDPPIVKEHSSSSHREYIIPIVVAILTVPMLIVLALFLFKKGSEFWERRHYRRMDFLIDGMYND